MKSLLLIGCFTAIYSFGQSLTPEVVGTAGDHFTNGSAQLSWTVGEVAIETYTQSSNQLTQGFHQYVDPTLTIQEMDEQLQITAYPNPFSNNLTVSVETINQAHNIIIQNSLGQEVLSASIDPQQQNQFDTSALAAGMYYVFLISNDGIIQTIKVQKR